MPAVGECRDAVFRELGLPSLVPQLPIAENAQPLRGGDEVMPLRELERHAIQRALRVTRGSVGRAAKLLSIGRATLYRRIATLDLSRDVA